MAKSTRLVEMKDCFVQSGLGMAGHTPATQLTSLVLGWGGRPTLILLAQCGAFPVMIMLSGDVVSTQQCQLRGHGACLFIKLERLLSGNYWGKFIVTGVDANMSTNQLLTTCGKGDIEPHQQTLASRLRPVCHERGSGSHCHPISKKATQNLVTILLRNGRIGRRPFACEIDSQFYLCHSLRLEDVESLIIRMIFLVQDPHVVDYTVTVVTFRASTVIDNVTHRCR